MLNCRENTTSLLAAVTVFSMSWSLVLAPASTVAAEWDTNTSVSLGQTYTDNVRLVDEGEESDTSTVVTTDFDIRGKW